MRHNTHVINTWISVSKEFEPLSTDLQLSLTADLCNISEKELLQILMFHSHSTIENSVRTNGSERLQTALVNLMDKVGIARKQNA
jgi:hypothetical protein